MQQHASSGYSEEQHQRELRQAPNGPPGPWPHPNLTHGRTQRCLASNVVRYAGEAVAFVVAENRAIAEDAAELVEVDYEPLPVVITPELAARADRLVHDDVPGNVAADMKQEVGDVDAALAGAPRRKSLRLRFERGAAAPQNVSAADSRRDGEEGRGCPARPAPAVRNESAR